MRKGESDECDCDITIEGFLEWINERNIVTGTATLKLTDSGSE